MARNIYVGDTVETTHGKGVVLDARSWRECITDMNDWEAREFSDKCRIEAGMRYKEKWIELLVRINGKRRRYLGHQVKVLEGRDV